MRDQRSPRVLLLTSLPGVGKTTVLRKVAERLHGRPVAGFLTDEIRSQGRRLGFRLASLDGHSTVLSHVEIDSPYKVGRYGVDVPALEKVVEEVLARKSTADVLLIDEIGKMECLSSRFVAAMSDLLETGPPLVATVASRGGGFIAAVKRQPGAVLWQVTRENRDRLPDRVLDWLDSISPSSAVP